MAIAAKRNAANTFELDPLPELLNASPDAIKRFNEGLKEWKRRTEVRLSERLAAPTAQT
jgi:hypothetical protein